MSYQVLYRKYRPTTFDEVVGQEYIIKTIRNAIDRNELAHAYLFCGPRGTGKTSLAKLFAKTINCESENRPCGECNNCKEFVKNTHPDIIELDAASNNSVDDIRDIVESVKYPPMMGKYKVYIIDEVHMLSASAFNALLKTLEEPPTNVIFILATTEPQKIISTVLSRCQRYNFSKINKDQMYKRVVEILNKENIPYEENAVDMIIDLADGGMRDVLSILEQVLSYGNNELKEEDVLHIYGLLRVSDKVSIIKKLRNNEVNDVISDIREMYHSGVNINQLTQDLVKIYKEMLLYKVANNLELIKYVSHDDIQELVYLYNENEIAESIDILIKTIESYRNTSDILSYLEIALLKLASINKIMNNTNNTVNTEVIKNKKETNEIPKSKIVDNPQKTIEVFENKPEVSKESQKENEERVINEEIIKENSLVEEIPEMIDEDNIFRTIEINLEELLSILIEADKDEKIKDMVIYHNLANYSYEPTKRKFFNFLKESEIFASHKDVIIFGCKDSIQMNQINDLENNKEIYYFLKEEYNIDKMVIGITKDICKELAKMYVNRDKYDIKKVDIKRYNDEKKELTIEDKLNNLFGEVKIEE